MAASKTSISIAPTVRAALLASQRVTAVTSCVYPVVKANAEMPYVFFKRSGTTESATKMAVAGDSLALDVLCVAADYDTGVELAEAVREALEGVSDYAADGGARISRAQMADACEDYIGSGFVQLLTFNVKTN